MSDVNYEAVDIPDDKPPSEYHWTERRAEILQLIAKAGHPDSISPTRLADRYDVLTYRWWVSRIDCWLRFSSRPHRGVHGARVFRASFARAMGSEHAGKTVTVAVLDVDLEEPPE